MNNILSAVFVILLLIIGIEAFSILNNPSKPLVQTSISHINLTTPTLIPSLAAFPNNVSSGSSYINSDFIPNLVEQTYDPNTKIDFVYKSQFKVVKVYPNGNKQEVADSVYGLDVMTNVLTDKGIKQELIFKNFSQQLFNKLKVYIKYHDGTITPIPVSDLVTGDNLEYVNKINAHDKPGISASDQVEIYKIE